jgi:ADP-heptose:LPS heptosyltransferase
MEKASLRAGILNVGLVWSSGDWNPARNVDLAELLPLTRIDGVQLFSLQRGEAAERLRALKSTVCTECDSGTVLDTAAAILNLDLIISVDTMVAHLAGALGKPVWLLLPFSADWRWMAAREDSPWYPTMRLFRQARRGDWKRVIERLILKLLRLKNGIEAFRDQTSCGSCSLLS